MGVCIHADDSIYVGTWIDGKPNGKGVFFFRDN